jgi:hypothetical protein
LRVEQALEKLRAQHCLLLMTAHQRNLFAYGNVLRKATLNRVLAERLSELLDVPVVTFFGLADQDFKMMLNRAPKPSRKTKTVIALGKTNSNPSHIRGGFFRACAITFICFCKHFLFGVETWRP